ncbi:MAG: hypothetical protein ACQCN6_01825 [Candidatus Bathyarchaeia archaeon]|jgi:hypothetical protein
MIEQRLIDPALQTVADKIMHDLPEELAAALKFELHSGGDSLVLTYPPALEKTPEFQELNKVVRGYGGTFVSRKPEKSYFLVPRPKPKVEPEIRKGIVSGMNVQAAAEQIPKPAASEVSPQQKLPAELANEATAEREKEATVKQPQNSGEIATVQLQNSYSTPSEIRTPAPEPPEPVTLKTTTGTILGTMQLEGSRVFIRPEERLCLNINTPPFSNFLVEKVLLKMHEKTPAFNYDIVNVGDVLSEIILTGATAEQFKELQSAVRWTFEKMHEKQNSDSQPHRAEPEKPAPQPQQPKAQPQPEEPRQPSPKTHFETRYCTACDHPQNCDPDRCLQILNVLFLDDIRESLAKACVALEKTANRPVYRGGGGGQKRECHVDGGIKWFWTNETHTYEKAPDNENMDSKEYQALKKQIEDAVAVGKTGVFVGDFWCMLDRYKKDGVVRKKTQTQQGGNK